MLTHYFSPHFIQFSRRDARRNRSLHGFKHVADYCACCSHSRQFFLVFNSHIYLFPNGELITSFPLFFVVAGAALFVVTGEGAFDHRVGYGGGKDFVHFDDFAFELLVILKKSADHGEFVGRQLAGFVI